MKPLFSLRIAAHALAALFFCVSSMFAILAFIPFTYHEVIEFPMVSWQPLFLHAHHIFAAVAGVLGIFALSDLLRRKRVFAILASLVFIGVAVALFLNPILAHPRNARPVFDWSLIFLAPVFAIGIARLVSTLGALDRGESSEEISRVFQAAVLAALVTTLLFRLMSLLRNPASDAAAWLWSLDAHLLGFMAIFLAIVILRAIAASTSRAVAVEMVLLMIGSGFLAAFVTQKVILEPIAFRGDLAQLFAALFGGALTITFFSISATIAAEEPGIESGLEASLAVLPFRNRHPWWRTLIASVIVAAIGVFVALRVVRFDWNFLFQKLLVTGAWLLAFAASYALVRRWRKDYPAIAFGVALLFLAGHVGLEKLGARPAYAHVGAQLESAVNYDASFRMLHEALAPKPPEDEGAFYRLLQASTNIPRTISTPPVNINLANGAAIPIPQKPHIFILVIDSLRRDYLAPYNPRVTFTPSIAAFARDSVVFRNAFSHYGGTGLSEPAIWTGGLLLHKQYVTPFRPMNSLLKLVSENGYQPYISFDSVLQTIVGPSKEIVSVDPGGINYDYCRTVADLQTKIATRWDGKQPIFSYVQPQNIHISTVHREGESVPTHRQYPGFYAPYASRLELLDACFGHFIEFLKERNLYDSSIIIVTSDHGDSLGEGGRWGHAYTIYPEIVRVPLIVHLPPAMRQSLRVRPDALTFTTDITPSFYYLLGHRDLKREPFFGKPLFTDPATKPVDDRDRTLMVSSYGPVYGILDNNGTRLFIADALDFRDGLYDVATGEKVWMSDSLRREYHDEVRRRVETINGYYHFAPK